MEVGKSKNNFGFCIQIRSRKGNFLFVGVGVSWNSPCIHSILAEMKCFNPTKRVIKIFLELYMKESWKKNIYSYRLTKVIFIMNHYSTNIQNRKLKKQVLNFLRRINFGASKLPFSGKLILIFTLILLSTLFFPWLELKFADGIIQEYSAFSAYTGYIGFLIAISIIIIPFFLVSHTKKERIRSNVPFRLSDTQVVVFLSSMIFVGSSIVFIMSSTYKLFGEVHYTKPFSFAISSALLIIITGFFLSRSNKLQNTESYYLSKEMVEWFDEYKNIIQMNSQPIKEPKNDNMSLPI